MCIGTMYVCTCTYVRACIIYPDIYLEFFSQTPTSNLHTGTDQSPTMECTKRVCKWIGAGEGYQKFTAEICVKELPFDKVIR